ncbi:hypothetical protein CBS101457_006074 [Exobasidium rhododendri]|nr:hypothetical protein CBS101457_006074 [Exobasidium rhododendri]
MPSLLIPRDDGTAYIPIISHLSTASLEALQTQRDAMIRPQTMYWYPINFVIFNYGLWLLALVLKDYVLPSRHILGSRWTHLAKHQRTMIVYLLSILVTLIALTLQLSACGVFGLTFTPTNLKSIRCTATLISALYLFELTYREKMRFAMIVHHTLTVFACSFIAVLIDQTHDPSFFITANLWLLQATTEQFTFLALFGYRLQWTSSFLRPLLYFSSVQALVLKFASIIAIIYVWCKFQKDATSNKGYDYAWDVVMWLAAVGLMITQIWGSWVVWVMGSSLEARYEKTRAHRGDNSVYDNAAAAHTSDMEVAQKYESDLTQNIITPALLKDRFTPDKAPSSLYYSRTSSSDKTPTGEAFLDFTK